ncbi:MAG TPA: hypothetical protein VFK40_07750 [Nitrososphaeraceae archaeon]|nr:hypothetical protein [Nitrososphaeraceae archaeon]
MEPQKKPKVIYFLKDNTKEVEKIINEFLSEHDDKSVKKYCYGPNRSYVAL